MLSRAAWLLVLVSLGCGGSRPPPETTVEDETAGDEPEAEPPPPAPPEARVRLIHAAIESRDQALSLAAESSATDATGYQFASAYLGVPPGDHTFSARANDAELIGATFSLPEGLHTVVAYSAADFPVALALVADAAAPAPADSAQIRVFHAIVGQGAIDVCAPPATARGDGAPIVPNVPAGTVSAADGTYVSVPAGAELPLQIRAHHSTPCHGRAIGIAHGFVPVSESNYTLVFVGRSGRRSVAPELLFCADPPAIDTSCATLAIDAH